MTSWNSFEPAPFSRQKTFGTRLCTTIQPFLHRLTCSFIVAATFYFSFNSDSTNHTNPTEAMASRIGPRTVKDATRFTSTIPHATSKTAGSASPSVVAGTPRPSRIPGETPEQRVKRLRLAHLAAQKAQISQTDRIIDASRRFFDVAHRWTVGGIVVFTGKLSLYRPDKQMLASNGKEWID